ncbi:MAG: hypothetical protein GY749_33485 [Desulfobacteraceae bacterium]|nr:hypothetical protein [Desulfobacteraceae bacterium]
MKMHTRLLLISLLATMALLILSAISYRNLRSGQLNMEDIYSVHFSSYKKEIHIKEMARTINSEAYKLLNIIYAGAIESEMKSQLEEIEGLFSELIKNVESIGKTANPAYDKNPESKGVANLQQLVKTYQDSLNNTIEVLKEGDTDIGAMMLLGTEEHFQKIDKIFFNLAKLAEENAETAFKFSIADYKSANIWFAVSVIFIIVTSLLISYKLNQFVSDPIRHTASVLKNSSEQTSGATRQVASTAKTLADDASEAAASLEETSSSAEEIDSVSKRNTGNAHSLNVLMKDNSQIVSRASLSVKNITSAMSDIAETSYATSNIVKTIEEIAFQTNLLALNAAVEAARAGEAGTGFAVVADEVKNLASKASEAVKNTTVLIENTVKKVSDGEKLVNKTNEDFVEVGQNTSKISDLATEIAVASQEQTKRIDHINRSIGIIDKIIQKVAVSAEELAGTSEEMNSQSEQMKDIVGSLNIIV